MSVKSSLTSLPRRVRGFFLAAYDAGANVWTSYFLYSTSFHFPDCTSSSVTSVTSSLRTMPERAASVPSEVREISLSVSTTSLIMPLRPLRSLTTFGSASFSDTGAFSISAMRTSSGICWVNAFLPASVRERTLVPASSAMEASFFLINQPTAILSSPGIACARSPMDIFPPAASIAVRACLSGRPLADASGSVSAYDLSLLSFISARPLDASQEADPMTSTSREKSPPAIMSAGLPLPPFLSSARRSFFSL